MLNKFTIGLLVIIGFYSYTVMQGEIILGISNTAPFSPWSFGVYLARVLPLLLVALLFFVSFLYSAQAKRVEALTDATHMKPSYYRMMRYGAIAVAFLLLITVPIIYAFWFYGATFHFTAFHTLLPPLVFVIIPPFFLVMGLGTLVGRFHSAIVFSLMPVMLLLGFLPLPDVADLYGTALLTHYPASLGMLDPVFQLPGIAIMLKSLFALVGIILTVNATFMGRSQHRT